MPESDIRTLVSLETDDKGVDAARKALKSVVKEQQELTDAFKRGEKSAEQFNKEMADAVKREKSLEKAIDAVTGEFTEQAKAIREATEESKRLAEEQERLSTSQGRFDDVSQKVALAGDTESSLRTIGGAIGAFGGSGIEGGIGKASELFAVVEALPRLKAAASGLPNVISSAGAALGTSGAGFVGALGLAGLAIAAVTIAFNKFMEDAKKQADELNAVVEARRDVAQDIAGGLTTEEADTRLEEINRQREAEAELLADLKAQYDANITSQNALFEGVLRLTPQEQALADQIKTSESNIQSLTTEETALNAAREDGSLSANDAKAAEEALAQQRQQQLFTDAAQAGELASLKARVVDLTQEQIDGELKGLKVREVGLKAEIAALEASGSASEETAAKIAQLRDELGNLGDQSNVLQTARKSARSETAEKAAEEAKQKREQAAKERQAQAEQAARDRDNTRKQREQEAQQAQKEAEAAQQRVKDFEDKVREDKLKAEIDYQHKLEDIVTSFGDKRFDALEEQNFLALDKLNTEQARANRDASTEDQRARDELTRNAESEQRRLLDEAQRASQQRLQIEATGQRRSLDQQRQFWQATNNLGDQFIRQMQARIAEVRNVGRQYTTTGTQPRSR